MLKRLSRLSARLTIDGLLCLLFVTALAYRSTGAAPHEWIGIGFVALFALHIAVNLGWYKALFRGRYGLKRTLSTLTNTALLVCMILLCGTGILSSRHVFGFSRFFDGESLRQIHSLTAYWGLVIVGIHAGLHGSMILGVLRKAFGAGFDGKTGIVLRTLAAFAIAVCGVWAFQDRDMTGKLFLGFSFDFWDPTRPLALFFLSNLSIIGLCGIAAYFIEKIWKAVSKNVLAALSPASSTTGRRPSNGHT